MTELDPMYSTTRQLVNVGQDEMVERVKKINNTEDKFETVLFLSEGENRQSEGGLRTQGLFKQAENDKPLISVVTVVYNGEQFLEETILSVINQTYSNIEYIIIDGCSSDGTIDIIRKYEHAIDYWVSEKDKGIYNAMNKGVKCITGNWYLMLNAGDSLYHESVISSVDFNDISRDKVVYGKAMIYFENSFWLRYLKLDNDNLPCHQAIFIPYHLAKKNMYDEAIAISSDTVYLNKIFKDLKYLHEVPLIISNFEMGGVSNFYNSFSHALIHAREKRNIIIYFKVVLKYIMQKILGKKRYMKIVLMINRAKDG